MSPPTTRPTTWPTAGSFARAAALAAALALPGCLTTSSSQPVGADQAVLMAIPVSRAWIVHEGDQIVGSVIRYSETGADGRFLYVVRNPWDQDLGVIDERGRAWRRIPHQEDHWIGTGTVLHGVRQILDTGIEGRLVEIPASDVEAAMAASRGR
ncbi:MAG: hypothetical protein ACJAZN_003396 [Planctomycetota bacterium]|jgi:hypothetical protein